jgi:UDP:flavonoid glycosyltransferase YjiC (YdhE family)
MAYRGDVFPYVPIASELSRRGHDVTFVVPLEFHPSFADEPFRCVHSGTDFGPVALDEHADYVARWGMPFGGALLLRLYFGVFTIPHLDEMFTAIDDEIAHADLLFAHPAAAVVGAMACEQRGVPWVVGDLFPMLIPTATAPPAGIPNLGPKVNRVLWRAARSSRLDRISYSGAFKDYRRRLGLPAPDDWNVIDARLSPRKNVGLMSRHYLDAADDWPDSYELVGFTPWAGPDDGRLADDVVDYLAAGDAPVVVTLGTSAASAKPEVFGRVADALDRAGERGIFLTSNTGIAQRLEREIGPSSEHGIWPFVPLEPLLGHCRAIVHSGAHGTNALALGAGIPSVILPCLYDQRWHAQRQQELGTGIWARRLRDLDPAIDRAVRDEKLATTARDFAARLATEHGTARACDAIEATLA